MPNDIIDQKYFEENFIVITEEYKKYEVYCNNVDYDLIESYLNRLSEKYNVQLQ